MKPWKSFGWVSGALIFFSVAQASEVVNEPALGNLVNFIRSDQTVARVTFSASVFWFPVETRGKGYQGIKAFCESMGPILDGADLRYGAKGSPVRIYCDACADISEMADCRLWLDFSSNPTNPNIEIALNSDGRPLNDQTDVTLRGAIAQDLRDVLPRSWEFDANWTTYGNHMRLTTNADGSIRFSFTRYALDKEKAATGNSR